MCFLNGFFVFLYINRIVYETENPVCNLDDDKYDAGRLCAEIARDAGR